MNGIELQPRLPIHDRFIRDEEALRKWVHPQLHANVQKHYSEVLHERLWQEDKE